MNIEEFIKKWNKAYFIGKVDIIVAKNNEEGIKFLSEHTSLDVSMLYKAFKEDTYKYDDLYIYIPRSGECKLYSIMNLNLIKTLNYELILES